MTQDLPKGWVENRLGELVSTLMDFRGRTPKKLGMAWGGGRIPALSAINVRADGMDLTRTRHFGSEVLYKRWMTNGDVSRGDVVVTTEAPLGNVAQIPDDRQYILSQRVILLKAGKALDPAFLAHQLRSPDFQRRLIHEATGTTATGIRQSKLVKLQVRLPPILEQRRIVAKVDELLAELNPARDCLAKVPGILKRFRQSVLAAACSGRLTEDWNNCGAPQEISYRGALEELPELPDFPAHWNLASLEQVSTSLRYGSNDKAGDNPDGVPMLRMGNIQEGAVDLSNLKYVRRTSDIDAFRLHRGDILFNRTNSPELVGKAAVYESEREAIYASYIVRVRAADDRALPAYVAGWINGPWGRAWARHVRTDGVSQSNINATKLAQMPIPMPSLDEQRQIVSRTKNLLHLAERLELALTGAKRRVDMLTQSILSRAFRGELVPTEAELAVAEGREFESAEQLLARVRGATDTVTTDKTPRRPRAATRQPRRNAPRVNRRVVESVE